MTTNRTTPLPTLFFVTAICCASPHRRLHPGGRAGRSCPCPSSVRLNHCLVEIESPLPSSSAPSGLRSISSACWFLFAKRNPIVTAASNALLNLTRTSAARVCPVTGKNRGSEHHGSTGNAEERSADPQLVPAK